MSMNLILSSICVLADKLCVIKNKIQDIIQTEDLPNGALRLAKQEIKICNVLIRYIRNNVFEDYASGEDIEKDLGFIYNLIGPC